MQPSKNLTLLLDAFESCAEPVGGGAFRAYLDVVGVPTIGWGTTVYPDTKQRVKLGDTCAQSQADAWRDADVAACSASVNSLLAPVLAAWDADPAVYQDRFDSLCDFTYNLGCGNLKSSTLLRLVLAGLPSAADEFPRWTLAGGGRSNGLLRRRLAERALFLSDFRPDGSLRTEASDFPDAQWYPE